MKGRDLRTLAHREHGFGVQRALHFAVEHGAVLSFLVLFLVEMFFSLLSTSYCFILLNSITGNFIHNRKYIDYTVNNWFLSRVFEKK